MPPRVNEPYFSVRTYDAVVECTVAALAYRSLTHVVDRAAVLGMDELEAALIAGAELARRDPEEPVQLA
jgi:hypothetical protein